jgi:hypothetical protein
MEDEFRVENDEDSSPVAHKFTPRPPAMTHSRPNYNGLFRVPLDDKRIRGRETSVGEHFRNDAAIAKASLADPELVRPCPRDPFSASRHSVCGLIKELSSALPPIIESAKEQLSARGPKSTAKRTAIKEVMSLPSLFPKPIPPNYSSGDFKRNSSTAVTAVPSASVGQFEDDSSDEELNQEMHRLLSQRVRQSSRRTGRNKVFSVPERKTTALFLQNAFYLTALDSSAVVTLLKGLSHEELQKRLAYCCRRLKRAIDRDDFFAVIRSLFSRKVIESVNGGADEEYRGGSFSFSAAESSVNTSFSSSGVATRNARARFKQRQEQFQGPANFTDECLAVRKADTDAIFCLLRGESSLNTIEVRVVQTRLESIIHGGLLDATLRLLQTIFLRDTYAVVHSLLSCFEVNILLELLRRIFRNRPVPEYYEGILVDPDITPKLILQLERINVVLKRNPQGSASILDLREALKTEFPDTITAFHRIQTVLQKMIDEIVELFIDPESKNGRGEKGGGGEPLDDFEELQRALYADNEADEVDLSPQKRDLSTLIKTMKKTAKEKNRAELRLKAKEMVCDQFMREDRLASREYTRQSWSTKNGQLVKLQNISHIIAAVKRASAVMSAVDAMEV